MFFIGIFGGGTKARRLGSTRRRECPRCRNTEPWTVIETSKYFSAFFIPIARWGRRRIACCPICGEEAEPDSRGDFYETK